jgi:hypothetical protein
MTFADINIVVNGVQIKTNIHDMLDISDISADMDKVASQIAYWGAIWASAEAEAAASDAFYRKWRADFGKTITESAEWRVRQGIESQSEFHTIKTGIANATRNVVLAKTMYEALKTKASMLQSKGAMMRAELDSTSMHTPSAPRSKRIGEEKRHVDKMAMKEIFRKKQKM